MEQRLSPKRGSRGFTRRALLRRGLGTAVAACLGVPTLMADTQPKLKGRIKHSVAFWCFHLTEPWQWDIRKTCREAKLAGCTSVELADPQDWPVLKQHGLRCAITLNGVPGLFVRGFNNPAYHAEVVAATKQRIEACAENLDVCDRVIAFTGYRYRQAEDRTSGEIPPEDGAVHCVAALKHVARFAEQRRVFVDLEMLNSRVVSHPMKGHPGYQGDHLDYVADIVRRVGSPNVRLLFDIYHVQVMDGDVSVRLRECCDIIGHVHTAGNPGRGELHGEQQEINYPALMRTLLEIGYTGYVGHEFIPTRDPEAGLLQAVALCDV